MKQFLHTNEKKRRFEKYELNRASKDSESPLEDKLQTQEQINDDNNNDNDEQIEVKENISNNFGKEKFMEKKFLTYKYESSSKEKHKSNSLINRNNN